MRTENMIVIVFFIGSCQLKQFLLETKDVTEHGTDYDENYDGNYDYYYDYQGNNQST